MKYNRLFLPKFSNIIHLWNMDEESGIRYDEIGSCHLTDNNTVLYGTGKLGNGADFELATSEYLDATSASSSDMNFTDGNFTISFWAKPESLPVNSIWISRCNVDADGWEFLYHQYSAPNYRIRFALNTAGVETFFYSKDNPSTIGTWVHITVVRNGTTGYIYVNGTDQTSASDTLVDAVSSGYSFKVGIRQNNTLPYDGLLDELTIWNVALSSAEVSTLYNYYQSYLWRFFGGTGIGNPLIL